MSKPAYGYWEVTIEKQGRMKFPSALLKQLPEEERKSFYITHGFGSYVMVWTQEAYQKKMEELDKLNKNIIEVRKYRNSFLRNTVFVELDGQDRFVVPKALIERYKLHKEVVVLLDNRTIELWNLDTYQREFDMDSEEFAQLNEEVSLGIFNQYKNLNAHESKTDSLS
jgi:MraZ protein